MKKKNTKLLIDSMAHIYEMLLLPLADVQYRTLYKYFIGIGRKNRIRLHRFVKLSFCRFCKRVLLSQETDAERPLYIAKESGIVRYVVVCSHCSRENSWNLSSCRKRPAEPDTRDYSS